MKVCVIQHAIFFINFGRLSAKNIIRHKFCVISVIEFLKNVPNSLRKKETNSLIHIMK